MYIIFLTYIRYYLAYYKNIFDVLWWLSKINVTQTVSDV